MENAKKWFKETKSLLQFNLSTAQPSPFYDRTTTTNTKPHPHLSSFNHHSPIHVVSPFYDRTKVCRAINCTCPYHKRLRFQNNRLGYCRRTGVNTTQQSPVHKETINKNQEHLSIRKTMEDIKQKSNKIKLSKIVRFDVEAKVDSENQEFQRFLKEHKLSLLETVKYKEKDLHVIKKSVAQVFHFLYSNLHKPSDQVKETLDGWVKDRDLTHLYMGRFKELKEKRLGRLLDKKFKTSLNALAGQQDTMFSTSQGSHHKKLYTQFIPPRGLSFRDSEKSKHKVTNKRLWIKKILKDLQSGQDVDHNHLKRLASESVHIFIENFQYLKRNISRIDGSTLLDIKENILLKLRVQVAEEGGSRQKSKDKQRRRDELLTKVAQIDKVIELIQVKMNQAHSKMSQSDKLKDGDNDSSYSHRSRGSVKTKRGSKYSNFKEVDPNKQKSRFKPEQSSERCAEASSIKRSVNRLNTVCNDSSLQQMKTNKQVGKYRRLSHELFNRKKVLTDEDDLLSTLRDYHINSVEEIDDHLKLLADYVYHRSRTMNDIEGSLGIDKISMKESDSLLTIKRKARAYKQILTKDDIPREAKKQIKNYVAYLDQKNLAKNRKWAFAKIRNLLLGAHNSLELAEGQAESQNNLDLYFTSLMRQNFPPSDTLLFYNLRPTHFAEQEPDFDQTFLQITRNKHERQQQQRKTMFERKRTICSKRSKRKMVVEQQQPKESDLVQIGLNNRCYSDCLGTNPTNEHQYKELISNEMERPPKRLEDSYFKLYEKLVNL